jgi:hypothetical protein
VVAGADADHVGHAQAGSFRQPGADGVLQRVQALQRARVRFAQAFGAAGLDRRAHLHLAAFEPGREQLAQRRLVLAQIVRQAEAQVQEAAVDGADFQAKAAGGSASCLAAGRGRPGTVLGAGITGHAVNWHRDFSIQVRYGIAQRITGSACQTPDS